MAHKVSIIIDGVRYDAVEFNSDDHHCNHCDIAPLNVACDLPCRWFFQEQTIFKQHDTNYSHNNKL